MRQIWWCHCVTVWSPGGGGLILPSHNEIHDTHTPTLIFMYSPKDLVLSFIINHITRGFPEIVSKGFHLHLEYVIPLGQCSSPPLTK